MSVSSIQQSPQTVQSQNLSQPLADPDQWLADVMNTHGPILGSAALRVLLALWRQYRRANTAVLWEVIMDDAGTTVPTTKTGLRELRSLNIIAVEPIRPYRARQPRNRYIPQPVKGRRA